jgi:hypothetical protein
MTDIGLSSPSLTCAFAHFREWWIFTGRSADRDLFAVGLCKTRTLHTFAHTTQIVIDWR